MRSRDVVEASAVDRVSLTVRSGDDVWVCGYEKTSRAPGTILDSGGAVMPIHLSPDLEECARTFLAQVAYP